MRLRPGVAPWIVAIVLAWPQQALAQGDPVAQAHLGLARAYRGLGNLAGAAAEYERADRVAPLHGDVLAEFFWLALDRRASVTESLGLRILREQPQKADVRDALIGLAAARGDEATVMKLAGDGAGQHRGAALWYRRLGESLLRQKEFRRAAGEFQAAAAMVDGTQEDQAQAASALNASGMQVAALAIWHQIPPSVRHLRREWDEAWARAVLAEEAMTAAAKRLESDIAHHGDDQVHAWLFELHMRHGDAPRALGITQRADNPARDADAWLRRRAEAAAAAGDLTLASTALQRLVSAGRATPDDLWQLAAAYAASGDAGRAASVLESLPTAACDERGLRVLDRLMDSRPLTKAVQRRPVSCVNQGAWLNRIVERAVADGDHETALSILESLEGQSGGSIETSALKGQLLLWTGRPQQAVPLLERAVDHGAKRDVIDALVDAHRASGNAAAAWALARQALIANAGGDRLLTYAETALEAKDPEGALRLVRRSSESHEERGREVLGRALLMSGSYREARTVLRDHPSLGERESVTSAWLDALVATEGVEAALQEASRLAPPEWIEVAVRRTLWNERLGRAQAAGEALRYVERSDAVRAQTLQVDRLGERLAFASAAANAGRLDMAADAAASVLASEFMTELHHKDAIGILEQAMSAYWRRRDVATAQRLARRIMSSDSFRLSAWLVDIASAATTDPTTVALRLRDFALVFSANREALLAMAGQLAASGERARPEHIEIALNWTDQLIQQEGAQYDVLLARARLLVTAERWDSALSAVNAALQRREDQESLRLHAQVLGWSGDWTAALQAYDEYLAQFPEDEDAQREAARVEGWRQAFGKSIKRYAALLKQSGKSPLVQAELRAKRAYYGAQWGVAAREYERWVSLDPNDSEAAFERAQVLEAAGELGQAREAYTSILARVPHRQTSEALQRFRSRTQTGAQFFAASRTANGYDGLALLTVHELGTVLSDDFTFGERGRVAASVSRLRVGDASAAHAGLRATAGFQHIGSARWRVAMRAGVLSTVGASPTLDGAAGAWLRLGDAWELQGGVERVRLAENLPLFIRRAMETAWSGALSWTPSRDTVVRAGTRRARVFDGNRRTGVAVDIRQRVLRGRNELSILGRSDFSRNLRRTELYFSPARFLRSDAGAEWRHWIRSPRFMSDRGSSLIASYLAGVDDRRMGYHSFSGGGEFRITGSGLLTVNAQWVRSRVYTSLGVSVAVQLLGANSDAAPSWGSSLTYPR